MEIEIVNNKQITGTPLGRFRYTIIQTRNVILHYIGYCAGITSFITAWIRYYPADQIPKWILHLGLIASGLTVLGQYGRNKKDKELLDWQRHLLEEQNKINQELICQQIIRAVLDTLVDIITDISNIGYIRANVMRLDENNKLKIWYQSGFKAEHSIELDLTWELGQGCAGAAVADNDSYKGIFEYTSSYEEFRNNPANHRWGLTPHLYQATKKLRTIISFPLRVNDAVVAVLNLDDTASGSESPLHREALEEYYVSACNTVERALSLVYMVGGDSCGRS